MHCSVRTLLVAAVQEGRDKWYRTMQYLARAISFWLRPGGMADSPLVFKDFKEIQNSLSDARKITKFSLQPKELYNLTIKNRKEPARYAVEQCARFAQSCFSSESATIAICRVSRHKTTPWYSDLLWHWLRRVVRYLQNIKASFGIIMICFQCDPAATHHHTLLAQCICRCCDASLTGLLVDRNAEWLINHKMMATIDNVRTQSHIHLFLYSTLTHSTSIPEPAAGIWTGRKSWEITWVFLGCNVCCRARG